MTTKEKVLQLLKDRPKMLSGEKIAQTLAISRTAVWKAIKELEKNGHHFEHSRQGYCYLSSDHLDMTVLKEQLPMLSFLQHKEISESTMKDAKLAAMTESLEVPALFLAEQQTGGHGRFQRPFFSPSGQIYMSLLLKPDQPFEALPQYTVLAAVATALAIDELTGRSTAIKWVNDLYLDGKKICGILSEATSDFESGQIATVVIGIGINFAIPQDEFPQELQAKATALYPDNTTATITRTQLIIAIWRNFFELIDALPNQHYLQIYREKSLVLGKRVYFTRQGITYQGVATDISNTGELLVNVKGQEVRLASGEISLDCFS